MADPPDREHAVSPRAEDQVQPAPGSDAGRRADPASRAAQAAEPQEPRRPEPGSVITKRTRISGTWVAVIVATVVLIFLLIFILQNLSEATVTFLGVSGSLPLGVALLFAAVAGALLVGLVGAARVLQLRRRVRRSGVRDNP